jgi:hypothetical protein
MHVFLDVDFDYYICANISVQKQHIFSVHISIENCGCETPIKTVGMKGHHSKISSI